TIKRKEFAGELLTIEQQPFSGRIAVNLDEKPLERLKEKPCPFDLPMKDKSHRKLFIRARFLDPVPAVFIDDEEILLAEKFRAIDYIFACFPILMYLVLGALPTIVAFFVLKANFKILRSKMRPSVKWAAVYGLDLLVFWIVYSMAIFAWGSGH
ncbi:MAG: hypothetical protein K2X81_11030, partial [Candidatus Obscuribacterales bacterium]|nr:hypothetical protein [Candidatus Obscuribacterales bacterium]